MATGGVTVHPSLMQQSPTPKASSEVEQLIALVEGCAGCSEQDLRARLSPYAAVAWCNSVDDGRYLVRFLSREGLSAAITALNGSTWNGVPMKVAPYSVGNLPLNSHQDSMMGSGESIPSILPGQLEYLHKLMAEEPQQQLTLPGSSTSCKYPELQPCHREWILADGHERLTPMEDEVLSLEESNSFCGSSGLSTSQLWTQRSIGAVARKDLAKFAALQSLAQQHSTSSTPTAALGTASSMALSSPWGSFSASSCPLDAPTDFVRRVSSPAGQSTTLTPCDSYGGVSSLATAVAEAGAALQQHMRTGDAVWGSLGQCEYGVGANGLPGSSVGICTEDSAALLRLQQSLVAQQQQTGTTSDGTPTMLPVGFLGPAGFGASDLLGHGLEGLGEGIQELLASSAGLTGAVPPPPPPPMQQGSMMMPPPPPPPPARNDSHHGLGSDGRLSGASSPVPAPPPRVLTPGGNQQNWVSPAGSPRYAGQQPQSPSNAFRGPARVSGRPFQPGMSNLSHSTNGAPAGLSHHASEQAMTSTYMSQQAPTYRSGSPVNRGPTGMPPPPPPPGIPHPGYAAASAAAAAGGVAGSPIPPSSPVTGRFDRCTGVPLPAMASAPASLLESLASTARASAAFPPSGDTRTPAAEVAEGRTGSLTSAVSVGLQADGALFVKELLQLMKADAAADNIFLSNLRDLLECALATSEQPVNDTSSTVAASEGGDSLSTAEVSDSKAERKAASTDSNIQRSVFPVDAAAFLGLLQEAAAPLQAAAAAAWGSSGHRWSRGGSNRTSDSSDSHDSICSAGGSCKPAQALEPGKGLRPLRTAVAGMDAPEMVNTPPAVLLRHLSKGSSGGSSMFYPLHPRTTTTGARDVGGSSCGGAAPGTPHGTPMLLVPQTLPELLSARAALIRLMISAQEFVRSPLYSKMAASLNGVAAVYDSMHDDPVVVKRRKCNEMAAMRTVVNKNQDFAQAVASISSLRNHIYSLSRKVLIGYGHVDGLPVDLLLGGLTSELAAILTDTSAQPPQSSIVGSTTSSGQAANNKAGSSSSSAGSGPQPCLPQATVEFLTCMLPMPKLALLVFAEFVPVDPAPCCITPAPGTPVAHATSANGALNSFGSDGQQGNRSSNLRDMQNNTSSSAEVGCSMDGSDGKEGWQQQAEKRALGPRHSRDGATAGRCGESRGLQHSSRSRSGCFNSSNLNDTKLRAQRRQQSGFDLAAEAKELEAAATAAAPLVAAAVCDLPSGRNHRRESGNGV